MDGKRPFTTTTSHHSAPVRLAVGSVRDWSRMLAGVALHPCYSYEEEFPLHHHVVSEVMSPMVLLPWLPPVVLRFPLMDAGVPLKRPVSNLLWVLSGERQDCSYSIQGLEDWRHRLQGLQYHPRYYCNRQQGSRPYSRDSACTSPGSRGSYVHLEQDARADSIAETKGNRSTDHLAFYPNR